MCCGSEEVCYRPRRVALPCPRGRNSPLYVLAPAVQGYFVFAVPVQQRPHDENELPTVSYRHGRRRMSSSSYPTRTRQGHA